MSPKLITVKYLVTSAGFERGSVVTVEESPYVLNRIGTTFEVVSEAPEAPQRRIRRKAPEATVLEAVAPEEVSEEPETPEGLETASEGVSDEE